MKLTYAQLKEFAATHGLELVVTDWIPDGFAYKEPDLTIGETEHQGQYVAYIPLSDWECVRASSLEDLQTKYKNYGK